MKYLFKILVIIMKYVCKFFYAILASLFRFLFVLVIFSVIYILEPIKIISISLIWNLKIPKFENILDKDDRSIDWREIKNFIIYGEM